MNIIDLSLTIDNECMTCGTAWHEKVKIESLGKLAEVGRNTSTLMFGSHSATHMDAPRHFYNEMHGVEMINLDVCVGPVTCVNFFDKKAGDKIGLEDVKKLDVTERMLFAFGWFKNWKTIDYYRSFPFFSTEAIKYLADSGMRLMALDTPSPDDGGAINEMDDSPNHKILLGRDVVIVEYLTDTDKIDFSKKYEIVALPLKIADADGAPSRVILREV